MITNKQAKRLGFEIVQERDGMVETRLVANGLRVLLSVDASSPVVAYKTLFYVGSRNETNGTTGLAHKTEHMNFKGTLLHNPKRGNGIFETFKPLGNGANASTSWDRTIYDLTVPGRYLRTCIVMESDRMRNLMLSQSDYTPETTVILNELRMGENDPDGAMSKEMFAAAFRSHSYHHPIIGWAADVTNVPLEKLQEFYNLYYNPGNALVIVVGGFDPIQALKLIAKHYGSIPAATTPIPPVLFVEDPQEGERRFEIRRQGDLPRLWMAFHIPEASHADAHAISALVALLGGSGRRSSLLHKRLIDTGLASSVVTWNMETRDPGLLLIETVVAPTSTPAEVEAALSQQLQELAEQAVDEAHLQRAKSANRKGIVLSALDPMQRASMIAEAEAAAGWLWMTEYDQKFAQVTPADVMRVTGLYLKRSNRTIGQFIPEGLDRGA